MNVFYKNISTAVALSTFLLSTPLAVVAATSSNPPPSAMDAEQKAAYDKLTPEQKKALMTPPAIDVSKLSPEQKAAYDKLTPEQKKALQHPPPFPGIQAMASSTNTSGSATGQPTDNSAPATSTQAGDPISMYVIVAIGVLVAIGLGSMLARRRRAQI